MKLSNKGFNIFEVFFVIVLLVGTIGWGLCIKKAIDSDWSSPYKREAVYVIGTIIPPAGAFIGYIDISDDQ